jgi:hypothetical protein
MCGGQGDLWQRVGQLFWLGFYLTLPMMLARRSSATWR